MSELIRKEIAKGNLVYFIYLMTLLHTLSQRNLLQTEDLEA